MRIKFISVFALCCAVFLVAAPVYAGNDGHGNKGKSHKSGKSSSSHGKSKNEDHDNHGEHGHEGGGEAGLLGLISSSDRDIIKHYLSDDYNKKCPPGLAKKHNGCTPPGQSKRYSVGGLLSDDIILGDIPGDLMGRLRPAPHGHRYVRVDNDVLLIAEGTKKVIDAITLFSAVGN